MLDYNKYLAKLRAVAQTRANGPPTFLPGVDLRFKLTDVFAALKTHIWCVHAIDTW